MLIFTSAFAGNKYSLKSHVDWQYIADAAGLQLASLSSESSQYELSIRPWFDASNRLPYLTGNASRAIVGAHTILRKITSLPHRKRITIYSNDMDDDDNDNDPIVDMDGDHFTSTDGNTALQLVGKAFGATGGLITVHSYTSTCTPGRKEAGREVRGWTVSRAHCFSSKQLAFYLQQGRWD